MSNSQELLDRLHLQYVKLQEKNTYNEDLMVSTADLIKSFITEWNNTAKFLRIFKVLGFVSRLIIKLTEEEIKLRVK